MFILGLCSSLRNVTLCLNLKVLYDSELLTYFIYYFIFLYTTERLRDEDESL